MISFCNKLVIILSLNVTLRHIFSISHISLVLITANWICCKTWETRKVFVGGDAHDVHFEEGGGG